MKDTSRAWDTLCKYSPVMPFSDLFTNGKTKTCTDKLSCRNGIELVEPSKHHIKYRYLIHNNLFISLYASFSLRPPHLFIKSSYDLILSKKVLSLKTLYLVA
jgi:hypothetical protein